MSPFKRKHQGIEGNTVLTDEGKTMAYSTPMIQQEKSKAYTSMVDQGNIMTYIHHRSESRVLWHALR